ncbi:MAG: hypothetical protein ACRBBW_18065 [Cellvibrionaceae bacterium]
MNSKAVLVNSVSCLVLAGSAQISFANTTDEEWESAYQNALNLRAGGDLFGSIESLNNILNSRPTSHRARLELAVSYYRAARYEEAQEHAKRVLADPSTPANVRETIELFLDQVAAIKTADDEARHRYSGSIGIGAGYDDNVNVGPSQDTFDINGSEFRLLAGGKVQSDAFGSINLRGEHTYRMPGSVGIGERPVQMLWQSNASMYRKEYQDEHPYTTDVVSISTGPAWISRTNWRAAINLQADYIRLGDDALALYSSLNPSYTFISGDNEYNFRGQWLYREFMTDNNEDREGNRFGLGFDFTHRFNSTLSFQGGISGYNQDARVENQRYDAYEGYASLYWLGWSGGAVYGQINYEETDYDGEEILFATGRKEREQRYVLGMTHNFNDGAMQGWGVGARFAFTDTHANVEIYEYDRTEFTMDLTRRF